MSNDLVCVEPSKTLTVPTQRNSLSVVELAKHAFASGMFKKLPNASAAVILLQYGQDLGLSATTALTNIHFIDGKPVMSANLMWTLVQSDPDWEDSVVEESNNNRCVIQWVKRGKPKGKTIWTAEDAKLAGLVNKDNWKKFPRAMLFSRAVGEGFRMYCPQLGKGYTVYTYEEMGLRTDGDGNCIEDAAFTTQPVVTLTLEKVLEGSSVSREQAAAFLQLELNELDSLTKDELERLQRFVQSRS